MKTTCCIVGGGPAGVMLGVLLARGGVDVVVLEKHADFFRDFRGDTIHPSTLDVIDELGWLDAFLATPHQRVERLRGKIGPETVTVADFTHLPTRCRFIAFMPQWDFLDFLADRGRETPGFRLLMSTRGVDLIRRGDVVGGVRAQGPDGPLEIEADLTVACDGRDSTLVAAAGLERIEIGAPMDVFWFRLSKRPDDPEATLGRFDSGRIVVQIDRGDYFQCAYVFAKGGAQALQARGLPAFRADVGEMTGIAPARVADDLSDWNDVKLLSVAVDRLQSWRRPGFLAIGDAAHAMSPIGGVGVNLAIQDAVAAANRLAGPLARGQASEADLAAVQARRMLPTRLTQAAQVAIQNNVIAPTLAARGPLQPPLILRLLARFPALRRLPARLIGVGVRPEHVSPALRAGAGFTGAAATTT